MPSKGQTGQGAILSIGGVTGATGTETFSPLGQFVSASFAGGTRDIIDISTLASTFKEIIGGLADYGSCSIRCNRLPYNSDPGQTAFAAAAASQFPYDFKLQLPAFTSAGQVTTGDLIVFSAILKEFNKYDVKQGSVIQFDFTLQLNGAETITAGS